MCAGRLRWHKRCIEKPKRAASCGRRWPPRKGRCGSLKCFRRRGLRSATGAGSFSFAAGHSFPPSTGKACRPDASATGAPRRRRYLSETRCIREVRKNLHTLERLRNLTIALYRRRRIRSTMRQLQSPSGNYPLRSPPANGDFAPYPPRRTRESKNCFFACDRRDRGERDSRFPGTTTDSADTPYA